MRRLERDHLRMRGIRIRLSRLTWGPFGSSSLADEAAEREEYGLADRGKLQLERERFRPFETGDAASAALEELDEFKPPSS